MKLRLIRAGMFDNLKLAPRHDTQPEVIDPKTGKPFNLKDKEFPVVDDPSHKFKWSYWGMPKSVDKIKLDYLLDHFHYFNTKRFGGRLKTPEFRLLRDVNAVHMKLRGLFSPKKIGEPGVISISPNLFNAPHEGWVNRTLIHEMCHLDVWLKYDVVEKEEKGHGPLWSQSMRSAGLHPNRFDMESNETYADKKEKVVFEKKRIEDQPFLDVYEVLKATREKMPKNELKPGAKVMFASKQGIIFGEVIAKSKSLVGAWSIEETKDNGTILTWNVKPVGLYKPTFRDLQHKRYEA